MRHYVVFYGRTCGIFDNWEAVKASTSGYPGNKQKGYDTYDQAVEAWEKFEEDGTTPY
jgi:viroplasmin and RNaseH domain-containing protein